MITREKLIRLIRGTIIRKRPQDEVEELLRDVARRTPGDILQRTSMSNIAPDSIIGHSLIQGRKAERIRARQQYLREILVGKFGKPLSPEITEKIRKCEDLKVLKRVFQSAITIGKLEDLQWD